MHTAGILTLTLVFPMEGHASLIGEPYQQVSAGIDEMLADIQRVNGFHHVAPVIVTVTDQLHLLTVLIYGNAEHPPRLVGFHFQEFSREDMIPASLPPEAYSKRSRNPSFVEMPDTMR